VRAICWHEVDYLGVVAVGQLVPQVLVARR
jgi:hypothetical protein